MGGLPQMGEARLCVWGSDELGEPYQLWLMPRGRIEVPAILLQFRGVLGS